MKSFLAAASSDDFSIKAIGIFIVIIITLISKLWGWFKKNQELLKGDDYESSRPTMTTQTQHPSLPRKKMVIKPRSSERPAESFPQSPSYSPAQEKAFSYTTPSTEEYRPMPDLSVEQSAQRSLDLSSQVEAQAAKALYTSTCVEQDAQSSLNKAYSDPNVRMKTQKAASRSVLARPFPALFSAQSLKEAILLKEVLDTPKGLL